MNVQKIEDRINYLRLTRVDMLNRKWTLKEKRNFIQPGSLYDTQIVLKMKIITVAMRYNHCELEYLNDKIRRCRYDYDN